MRGMGCAERARVPCVHGVLNMTEPLEVFARGTTNEGKVANPEKVIGHACPECRVFFSMAVFAGCSDDDALAETKRAAAEHCKSPCGGCGVTLQHKRGEIRYTHCPDCRAELAQQRGLEAYDKAEKVHECEWSDPVFWDSHGPRDGHFYSVEDVREYCDDHGLELPKYVSATYPVALHIDADSVLECAVDEHHEGAYDQCDVAGLQKLLDAWCEAQKVTSYNEDRSKVVLLDGGDNGHKKEEEP
jgi:hypothetical protein